MDELTCSLTLIDVIFLGQLMVRQPLYNRAEQEYSFNVYILDGCGTGSSFIPVTITFKRNQHPPIFQVGLGLEM